MPKIGTSGSMSEDGKRGAGHRSQATAPVLDSTDGAMDRWAKGGRVPEGALHCVTTSRLTKDRRRPSRAKNGPLTRRHSAQASSRKLPRSKRQLLVSQ